MSGVIHHRSTEAGPGDRGVGFGRACRPQIQVSLDVYERMFSEDVGLSDVDVRARGQAVAQELSGFRPALLDEIEGIARGCDAPLDWLCAINARTELLARGTVAGAPARTTAECSLIGLGTPGYTGLGQTWDFHPDLLGARVLWSVVPATGQAWTTFTEAGMLAKIGATSSGLALGLNFLASPEDTGRGGIPIHILVRCILEECATIEQTRRLLDEASRSSSACLTVVAGGSSPAGGLVSFELSPSRVTALQPGRAGVLTHTNHFVSPDGVESLQTVEAADNSERRLARLDSIAEGCEDLDGHQLQQALSDTDDERAPIFRAAKAAPWLERCATLATIVIDVGNGRAWLRHSTDSDARFEEFPLASA